MARVEIVRHELGRARFFVYADDGRELYQSERECLKAEAYAKRDHCSLAVAILREESRAGWVAEVGAGR